MAARDRHVEWLNVRLVGVVLGAFAVGALLGGPLVQYGALGLRQLLVDLWANLGTEFASIAVTVLIIDGLNQRREMQRLRDQLTREMGSIDNATALRAVRELRAHGWLEDGSLRGANLFRANLEGAELGQADLREADLGQANLRRVNLFEADLRGAQDLTDGQLAQARSLRGARMPGGERYDGRFNLEGDLTFARRRGVDRDSASSMAAFYGVSPEAYERGQQWARENLPAAR